MKANHTTPIKEVLFRASSIGKLAQGVSKVGLTEPQEMQLASLEERLITPIGLTDRQQSQLNEWENKITEGGTLTPSQIEKREDFNSRLVTMKGLTLPMQSAYDSLIETRDAPPELAQTGKSYVKEVWLWYEKGFRQQINSKYLKKGIQAEEDAINLISFVNDRMYSKNTTRIVNGHLTGECDIKADKYIRDAKCVWNPMKFMNADLDPLYEWQLRAYMYLYNKDTAYLDYCLVDCPPEVLQDEFRAFCWNNSILDPDREEYKPLIDQFYANMLYENSGKYSREERVKTFEVERCQEKEEIMLTSIKLGLEYFQTITLNMK